MFKKALGWFWRLYDMWDHLSTIWQWLFAIGVVGGGGAAMIAVALATLRGMTPPLAAAAIALFLLLCSLAALIAVRAVHFYASYKRRSQPRLKLWHENREAQLSWTEGPGPMYWHIRVGLKNETGKNQENCQIQLLLKDRWPVANQRPVTHRWVMCEPFILRPDDTKYCEICRYLVDEQDTRLIVPLYNPENPDWLNELKLETGGYTFVIEALASAAPMVAIEIEADYSKDKNWQFKQVKSA